MVEQGLRSRRIANAILSILLLSKPAFSQDSTYEDTTTFASLILTETNKWRTTDQAVSATYNVSMADAAASYVTQCIFEHPSLYEQGSNLAAGFENPTAAVDAWYNEITDPGYDFATPGPQNGTLHFTQLVWNASTQIGCGAYYCNGTNGVPGWYTACYYYPEGNVVLEGNEGYYFELNVFPPIGNTTASSQAAAASTSLFPSTTSSSSVAASTTSSTAVSSTSSSSLSSIISSAGASAATSITTTGPSGSSATAVAVVASSNPIASANSTSGTITANPTGTTISFSLAFASPTSSIASNSTLSRRRPSRRQTDDSVEYITSSGTFTNDSSQAATFTLIDGQLFVGSNYFATDPSTAYELFVAASSGSISYTFSESNGAFTWTNGSFAINSAHTAEFAISGSSVYAAFQSLPTGATTVSLTAISPTTTTNAASIASSALSYADSIAASVLSDLAGLASSTAALPQCSGVEPNYVLIDGGLINLVTQITVSEGNGTVIRRH